MPSTMSDSDFAKETGGMFHIDCDGLAGVRLHIYLTDVGPGDAPLAVVPRSHQRGARERRSLIKRREKVIERSAVQRTLGPGAIREITGAAGTMILADSEIFHSATQATSGPRLCLTVCYTATAFNVSSVLDPVPVPAIDNRFRKLIASGDTAVAEFAAV